MKKPIVILADPDESYLAALELKFLEELNNKIELEVITQREYFEAYFKEPRRIDLLVTGEEFYSPNLQKHNVASLYVLSEMTDADEAGALAAVRKVYKYNSVRKIFQELMSGGLILQLEDEAVNKETQVIAVYSPIGGAGVTTFAVGLSAALAKEHKKVFFISTEALQNFQFFLNNQGYLPNAAYTVIKNAGLHPYKELKHYIRNELFYYLPPLYASLSALGLPFEVYHRLIEDVQRSRDYDYIVMDMGTGYQETTAGLSAMADKVMVLMLQDAVSIHKMESLMQNLELKGNEKFLFVCNRFQKEKKNCFVGSKLQRGISITEYIGELPLEEADDIIKLGQFGELEQLTYLFTE